MDQCYTPVTTVVTALTAATANCHPVIRGIAVNPRPGVFAVTAVSVMNETFFQYALRRINQNIFTLFTGQHI
jgi:hypothetical protein